MTQSRNRLRSTALHEYGESGKTRCGHDSTTSGIIDALLKAVEAARGTTA